MSGVMYAEGTDMFDDCEHVYVTCTDKSNLEICKLCGMEREEFDFNPEWKYFTPGKDSSRCHGSSLRENTIAGVFKECGLDISQAIALEVEKKFKEISKNSMTRSQGRKGIVAACLYHTYREMNAIRTTEYICKLMGLDMKSMSTGMQRYNETFPEARNCYTKPEDLLIWLMELVGLEKEHYCKLKTLTIMLSESTTRFKRSTPQTVATSVIYFYLCLNPGLKERLKITKESFCEKVSPSPVTITKLVEEAAKVTGVIITM